MHISNFYQLKIAYIYSMYFSIIFRSQQTFHECPYNSFMSSQKVIPSNFNFIPSNFKMRGYENPELKF